MFLKLLDENKEFKNMLIKQQNQIGELIPKVGNNNVNNVIRVDPCWYIDPCALDRLIFLYNSSDPLNMPSLPLVVSSFCRQDEASHFLQRRRKHWRLLTAERERREARRRLRILGGGLLKCAIATHHRMRPVLCPCGFCPRGLFTMHTPFANVFVASASKKLAT